MSEGKHTILNRCPQNQDVMHISPESAQISRETGALPVKKNASAKRAQSEYLTTMRNPDNVVE